MSKIINLKQKQYQPESDAEESEDASVSSDAIQTISWQTEEFERSNLHPKANIWMITIAIALIILSVFLQNYLFIIIILLIAGTFYIYSKKEPRHINIAIEPQGVIVDNETHAYEDLKSFWIFYDPPRIKQISIISKKLFKTVIRIPLADQNPVKIRAILLQFLPEIKQEESLADTVAKNIGF